MGARDYWDRMLVYFGIAEAEYDDDNAPAASDRSSGARRAPRGVAPDEYEEDVAAPRSRQPGRRTPVQRGAVGIVPPRTFNDAQQIADAVKQGNPVIVNLQATSPDLAKRIIDFGSGLTYGLDGSMQRIADKVFLLTPAGVDVSAEDRAAMIETGFFNQS